MLQSAFPRDPLIVPLTDAENPYKPPETDVNSGVRAPEDRFVPASRWSRLMARGLDGLFDVACVAPGAMIVLASNGASSSVNTASLVSLFALLGLQILQWSLLASTGQTLGKRLRRIRIIKIDGSQAGFGAGVVLRSWLMMIFVALMIGIPVAAVDPFFILGGERRCLHDYIAGTRVVRVLPPGSVGVVI